MLKVCLMAPMPPSCGGIASWSKMIIEYAEQDDEVEILPIHIGSKKVKNMESNIFKKIFYGLQDLKSVMRELKRNIKNIDVIHFATVGGLSIYRDRKIIKFAKKNHIPLVMHIRFGKIFEILSKKSIQSYFFKKNFRDVDKIISIDKRTFDVISKFYPDKSLEIINPIDTKKVKNFDKVIHKKNGIISFVGWVIKEKGIEELLTSFQELRKKRSDLKLNLIGPYNQEYYDYLTENYDITNVFFLGKQENTYALSIIAESEIFVLPSYTEGCPNVVLEAMLCKTPIVASAVGAIPELLSDESGLLIEPKNAIDLFEKMNYLLENQDLQETFINNAYNKIINDFSLEIVYKKYKEIWLELHTNKGDN